MRFGSINVNHARIFSKVDYGRGIPLRPLLLSRALILPGMTDSCLWGMDSLEAQFYTRPVIRIKRSSVLTLS